MRERGIVLISIMFLTLVTIFFIGALLQLNPTRLRRTVHDENRDRALAAAKAGIDFALNRLAENPDWRGSGQGVVVRTDQLVVREDRGNVWGWIRAKDGQWAGFCFRFNYQDGAGGADGLPQPEHLMPIEGISLNNLLGSSPAPLPLGDGSNYAFAGRYGYEVPENTLALVVAGMVGPDVAPESYPRDSSSAVALRQVEGLYKVAKLSGLPDGAVVQAGSEAHFTTGNEGEDGRGYLRLRADGQTAKMRAKGAASIVSGSDKMAEFNFYPDHDAEVRVGGEDAFLADIKDGVTINQTVEDVDDPLLDMAWSKVNVSSQADRLHLPAGVYAVSDGVGGAGRMGQVQYYPMSFEDYKKGFLGGDLPLPLPVPSDFPELRAKSVTIDGDKQVRSVIEFDRDVEVTKTRSLVGKEVDGIAIVPARGARSLADLSIFGAASEDLFEIPFDLLPDSKVPQDLEVHFAPRAGQSAAIRTEGEVLIGAHLTGKGGAVVAGQSIDLIGLGVDLEADTGERGGVSLFAQGPIRISTYDQNRDKYWDVSIKGIVFSKESVNIRLGENSTKARGKWGMFDLEGAVISLGEAASVVGGDHIPNLGDYPDDPYQSTAVSALKGSIGMIAEGIRLTYEPKFFVSSINQDGMVWSFQALSVMER